MNWHYCMQAGRDPRDEACADRGRGQWEQKTRKGLDVEEVSSVLARG